MPNNRAKVPLNHIRKCNGYIPVKLTQAINGSSNAPVQYFDFSCSLKAKESGYLFMN